jgi:ribosome-binding factor A
MATERRNPNRIDKVSAYIQQELGPILHEYTEELNALITISKVETSRDMKWVKIWISIVSSGKPNLSDAKPGLTSLDQKVIDTIQKNIYHIQGDLNKKFATKIVPRLQFFLDTSPRYVQHIDELLKEIHEEDEK